MFDLNRKINTVHPGWFMGLILTLALNACAFSRPLSVEKQGIDPSYRYEMPQVDGDG
jgi:hypothetical protein